MCSSLKTKNNTQQQQQQQNRLPNTIILVAVVSCPLGSGETKMMMMMMRRLLEACLVLIISIVCCSSKRLQAALRFSADHFRQLTAVLNNPRCVFLIGNAIVLAIVLMSRCLSSSPEPDQSSSESEGRNNLHHLSGADDAESYEEVEENLHGNSAAASSESDEVVQQQQQQQTTSFVSAGGSTPHVPAVVAAGESAASTREPARKMNKHKKVVVLVEASAASRVTTGELRVADRDRMRKGSQSMEYCGCDVDDETVPHHGRLRRSETIKCCYDWDWDEKYSPRYAMEELSSEEFRLAVEAFINKNRSLMKRESATTAMAVLCD